MSKNNIYLMHSDNCFIKYKKSVKHAISGWRIDPQTNKEVEFFIVNPMDSFSYDDDVLEVYSERENKFIIQRNKYLFEQGMLIEYKGLMSDVDLTNTLTEDEVEAVSTIKNINDLRQRLLDFDSKVTVGRILEKAEFVGRPATFIKAIKQRLEEIG